MVGEYLGEGQRGLNRESDVADGGRVKRVQVWNWRKKEFEYGESHEEVEDELPISVKHEFC